MSPMEPQYVSYIRAVLIGVVITVLLTVLVLLHYRTISAKQVKLIDTSLSDQTSQSAGGSNQFTAAQDTPWRIVKGNIYPYSFYAPTTLALTALPNNTYDIYAISWKNMPPDQNVLVGVDNLKNDASRSHFISEPKINYVREWYKQFGLKGVASLDTFTNSNGLKGYKAKYFDSTGATPNTDVFFEIPDHPEYIIHLASGVLSPDVFNKLIDSVSWQKEK